MPQPDYSHPDSQSTRKDLPPLAGREQPRERLMPPVEDPAEALEFCRALAAAMELASGVEGRRLQPAHIAAVMRPAAGSLPPPMLSIVIPVFNEEENLLTLHTRLTDTLTEQGLDYEIVFVDDGSQDQSPALLRRME
ncbi:MAG: glycosyltransferase, partial [Nitrospira sp.]